MKFNVSVYYFFSCMKIFTLQLISDYHYFLVLFTIMFVMNNIVKMKSAFIVLILVFLLHNNNVLLF